MTEAKLTKVTLEYEDRIQTLSGKEANDWLNEANGIIALYAMRSSVDGMTDRNWKIVKKKKLVGKKYLGRVKRFCPKCEEEHYDEENQPYCKNCVKNNE